MSGVLIVTELFNVVVNDFAAEKSGRYNGVFVVIEFVVIGTQCNLSLFVY